ncbi:replication initiator, partial [Streptomyces sp. UG1]|uniref:replication initiator n=1 Tax=Streptomyces sp. UG1 TaxID=3417652 RepID=UPI003CF725C4
KAPPRYPTPPTRPPDDRLHHDKGHDQRAAVHVHAIVRLDGPNGPDDEPPAWGTTDMLIDAVRASARRVMVRTRHSAAVGELDLRWGAQVDARPLRANGDGPDDDAVAAYVAKYVTKGASETGAGTDHPLTTWSDIESTPASEHVRTLMRTCWRLGGVREYAPLRLRAWAHTLGYRGHILTKSRAYSTTYAALRAERAHHMGHAEAPDALTERDWRYVGSGHTSGVALIAAGIADDLAESRRLCIEAGQRGSGADSCSARA